MTKSLFILLACLFTTVAHADNIEFPDEELARETTLPVFEKRRVVMNRLVETEKRFEFGAGAGLEMNEPYYNDFMLQFMGTYNIDNVSAVNVQALMWMDGLSSYGEQLKLGRQTAPVVESFDAMKAPHPKWGLFGNYEFIAYYGKISITKQTVMNLNLFGIAGLGYINMDTANAIALNLGLGQNFFFTKHFGLRADVRWLIFQGPNATTKQLRSVAPNNDPSPAASAFGNRIYYNSQIGLSAVFVL
ncbi:MAG: outer membrane beta-barrel domain-containing protein [Bdellovibrionales bacterium]|nr:outer membrane beta-barrel domain-containing protein [Bdellovibrionales bacterium]